MMNTNRNQNGRMLRICTRTWARDSHDLFDYETHDSKQLTERHFASSHALHLLRTDSRISIISGYAGLPDIRNIDAEGDHLLSVICRKPGEYILAPADRVPNQLLIPQRMWLVVRAMPKKRYDLHEHDIIKLGRYRLRVKKIVRDEELKDFDVTSLVDSPVPDLTSPNLESNNLQCRICLAEGSEDDKLLCPCDCKGSIKYVHADCMRRWIFLRTIKDSKESDQPLKAALLSEGCCELCKAPLPAFVRLDGTLVPLVMMPDLSSRFILLENITPHAGKGLHFISVPEGESIRIGRGHDASVRIADVSISRNHATIYYEDGKFYVEDNDSKFGTLVALRRPVSIVNQDPVAVQVGRSLIEVSLDPKLKFTPGCMELSPVMDCFKFCSAIDMTPHSSDGRSPGMSISSMATPIHSSTENEIEVTAEDINNGYLTVPYYFGDNMYPVSGATDSSTPHPTSPSPNVMFYLSENTPIDENINVRPMPTPVELPSMFMRNGCGVINGSGYPIYVEAQRCQEYQSVPTNDGMAYLRLITNTPTRGQILQGLRYQNRRGNFNRMPNNTRIPYFRQHRQRQESAAQAVVEETESNQCYLPENAFVNVEGSYEYLQNGGVPDGAEMSNVAFTPSTENARGLMHWNQNHNSSMQPPK